METIRKVVWHKNALIQLEEIYRYVRKHSLQNADNLKKEIHHAIDSIPQQPQKHPIDTYRLNNHGDYRAFELHHVRIAYKITDDYIFVIRVRSTHQEPKEY